MRIPVALALGIAVLPCIAFGSDEPRRVRVAVELQAPEQPLASAITLSLRYPATYAPAASPTQSLRDQVHPSLTNVVTSVRADSGSLRLVMARGSGFPTGEVCTIDLVTRDQAPPAADGFDCQVEAAGSATGAVAGVTCRLRPVEGSL